MQLENPFVPLQQFGSKLDIVAKIELDTPMQSITFFELVKQRLLDVNHWADHCRLPASAFRLLNSKNQEIVGAMKEKDYIRIDIPGIGPKSGQGFDWVRIENIMTKQLENYELLSVTVRPSNHPLAAADQTAHFFQSLATSTFQVKRYGKHIFAAVYGRNEVPNNKQGPIFDRFRNTMVAWLAKLGMSYPQWKLLVEGLLRK